MNDVTKRFIETYKSLGLTGYRMGKQSSVITKQKISNIEKGITEVSSEVLSVFFATYKDVNPEYILTGNGKMLKTESDNMPSSILEDKIDLPNDSIKIKKDEIGKIIDSSVMLVPLVNQYAHAGYMSGYADDEYVETLPKIPWIVDKEYKGRYISFEVKGDSMDDGLKHSYEQGDILLCREINPDYWKCKLHIHQWDAFVIVHKTEGIVVKQIIDHDVEKGIITVHSFNPIYEDYKIDLREVAQIFNVVKQQKNK